MENLPLLPMLWSCFGVRVAWKSHFRAWKSENLLDPRNPCSHQTDSPTKNPSGPTFWGEKKSNSEVLAQQTPRSFLLLWPSPFTENSLDNHEWTFSFWSSPSLWVSQATLWPMVFGCFRVQPIQKFSAVNEKYGFFSRFRTKIPTSLSLRKSGRKITDSIYHRVGITTCSKTFAEFWSELKNLCECAKVVSDFYLYQLVSEREQKTCVASQCCLPAIINRAKKKELGAPIFLSRKVSHSPPSPLVQTPVHRPWLPPGHL